MHAATGVNLPDAFTWQGLSDALGPDAESLVHLAMSLHRRPEVAFKERHAAKACTALLTGWGFEVTAGTAWGLPTAFRASYGDGALNVALVAEYDALPGLGHACGHNIIAAAAIGAARLLSDHASALGLTVTVMGTPGEEGGGGKALMLDRGAFEGVHAAAMVHPGPRDCIAMTTKAVSHLRVRYTGRAAHAAASPATGVNAADALVIAQSAIGLLRQHLPAGVLVHGIVTEGGAAPNVVPASSVGRWYVRADSISGLEAAEARIVECFRAGAVATGCEWRVEHETPRYAELRTDPVLAKHYARAAAEGGRPVDHDHGRRGPCLVGSTDMGNVSQAIPSIHPVVALGDGAASIHEPRFADLAGSPAASRPLVRGAVGLALAIGYAAADAPFRRSVAASPNANQSADCR